MTVTPSGNPTFPLEMERYFDADATGYDSVTVDANQGQYYELLSAAIDATLDSVRILDLGIGTGFEVPYILQRVPNARIVGVDLSARMLAVARAKHHRHEYQLDLIKASIFNWDYPSESFEYVVSAATMHHYLGADRAQIYRRCYSTLAPGGRYIEMDKVVSVTREAEKKRDYLAKVEILQPRKGVLLHLDVPSSVDTITSLLSDAGFIVNLPEVKAHAAVLSADKPRRG